MAPQPLTTGGSEYFAAFGLLPQFAIDVTKLERRFYALSRALHPDRFSTSDHETRSRSLDRMSYLNDAYRTLKSAETRRDYLLKSFGVAPAGGQGQLPMELAETWFEIQEDPENAASRLPQFQKSINELRTKLLGQIREWEWSYDALQDSALLKNIALAVQTLSYLKSLDRDMVRLSSGSRS